MMRQGSVGGILVGVVLFACGGGAPSAASSPSSSSSSSSAKDEGTHVVLTTTPDYKQLEPLSGDTKDFELLLGCKITSAKGVVRQLPWEACENAVLTEGLTTRAFRGELQ